MNVMCFVSYNAISFIYCVTGIIVIILVFTKFYPIVNISLVFSHCVHLSRCANNSISIIINTEVLDYNCLKYTRYPSLKVQVLVDTSNLIMHNNYIIGFT